MQNYKIAAIPADGIGPEVIDAGLQVLEALAQRDGNVSFDVTKFDWGSDYYKANGVMMPQDGLDRLKPFDASSSERSAPPMFRTMSPCGGYGCRSVRASINTPMCAPPAFCPEFPLP
jgi:hypothetical protein